MELLLLSYIIFLLRCVAFAERKKTKIFAHRRRGFRLMPQPESLPDISHVKTLWFEQKLDHFNNAEKRTWKQKYLVMTYRKI